MNSFTKKSIPLLRGTTESLRLKAQYQRFNHLNTDIKKLGVI
jgi:hypothetical protein